MVTWTRREHPVAEVESAISSFRPAIAISDERLEQARNAVRQREAIKPRTAKTNVSHIARLLAWAEDNEYDIEESFTPAVVDAYIDESGYSDSVCERVRRILRAHLPVDRRPPRSRADRSTGTGAEKIPPTTAEVVERYRPQEISDERWEIVGPITRDRVRTLPHLGPRSVTSYLRYASDFVSWAIDNELSPTPAVLFTPRYIGTYIDDVLGNRPQATRDTASAILRQMIPADSAVDFEEYRRDRIAAAISSYTPDPARVSPTTWEAVADGCREAVVALKLPSVKTVQKALSRCSAFLAWCYETPGVPNAPPKAFDDRIIARYIEVRYGSAAPSSKTTLRSDLRRMGRSFKRAPIAPPPEEFGRTDVPPPASNSEVRQLLHSARTQSTRSLRRKMLATICLARGAGVIGSSAAWICGTDVRQLTDGSVVIDVNDWQHDRTVVVADAYAGSLLTVAREAGSLPLIGGLEPGSTSSYALANFQAPAELELSTVRLRDAWVVEQITAGQDPRVIARQLGHNSLSVMQRVRPFLPPIDEAAAHARLRDPRQERDVSDEPTVGDQP